MTKELILYVTKKERLYVLQFTCLFAFEESTQREFTSIKDSFTKYTVSMDGFNMSHNGISLRNICNFLLVKEWN